MRAVIPDLRQVYPFGSVYRHVPPEDLVEGPDPEACLYCARRASLICKDHGAKLCGERSCTEFHWAVQRNTCTDFTMIAEPEKKPGMSRSAKTWAVVVVLLAVILFCAFGGIR